MVNVCFSTTGRADARLRIVRLRRQRMGPIPRCLKFRREISIDARAQRTREWAKRLMANILIVDDVADTCTMLKRLFSRCGHVASCLFEGSGVVEALRSQTFQWVLLGVMMPGMDGFAVLRAMWGDAAS